MGKDEKVFDVVAAALPHGAAAALYSSDGSQRIVLPSLPDDAAEVNAHSPAGKAVCAALINHSSMADLRDAMLARARLVAADPKGD